MVLASVLLLAGCDSEPLACPPEAGGNVMLVILDDMGLETVAAYGLHPDPPITPRMDGLAASGVRFDRAYSPPLCAPARATLLTGRYGRTTGFGTNIPFDRFDDELPLWEWTTAEAARDGVFGYATAGFGKWHLMTRTTPEALLHPNHQGFDHFDGTLANLTDVWDAADGLGHDYFHWEQLTDGVVTHLDGYAGTWTVDRALEALPALPEPWFVQVGLHLAHGPIHAPDPSLQSSGVTADDSEAEQFRALVEAADHEVGRLIDALPPDTTLIVVGDNGSELDRVRAPWVLQGGKSTLFDGGIRVPLIVAGPAVSSPGRSTDALVETVDVARTIADLTCGDLSRPADRAGRPRPLDGESFLPLLRDPSGPGAGDFAYSELFGSVGRPPYTTDLRAVVDHEYKLIRNVLTGEETLHAVGPSPNDESLDLLPTGEEGHYAELAALLDDLDREVRYDGPPGCAHASGAGPGALLLAFGVLRRRVRSRGDGSPDGAQENVSRRTG